MKNVSFLMNGLVIILNVNVENGFLLEECFLVFFLFVNIFFIVGILVGVGK